MLLRRASHPLLRKLELGAKLSDGDRAAFNQAVSGTRHVGPKVDLVGPGDRPVHVHGVLSGFACRYKLLPSGDRQIVALLVPGDFCDVHIHILGAMDHAISTLTTCEIALLSHEVVDDLITTRPNVARALWWASLVDEGTLREWLLSMGQRSATQQMAHLFCELRVRLESVGLVEDGGFDFPLAQYELGDLLGLSAVHANRTLQELRSAGLISLKSKRLQILDQHGLEDLATFDPAYLHLTPRQGSQR